MAKQLRVIYIIYYIYYIFLSEDMGSIVGVHIATNN